MYIYIYIWVTYIHVYPNIYIYCCCFVLLFPDEFVGPWSVYIVISQPDKKAQPLFLIEANWSVVHARKHARNPARKHARKYVRKRAGKHVPKHAGNSVTPVQWATNCVVTYCKQVSTRTCVANMLTNMITNMLTSMK